MGFCKLLKGFLKKAWNIFRKEGFDGVKQRLYRYSEQSKVSNSQTWEQLMCSINRVYDLPEVVVDKSRPKTINVLVPAFDFNSISAGFFGVFQAALFIARQGYHVRLVMFDNFYFNFDEANKKIQNYPGLETLFDEVEVDYIGERRKPLEVSEHDTSLATVWYSAYFAQKIQKACDGKPFLYLIQDYETHFYAGSSCSCLAQRSYAMNYYAMFSTKMLQEFFIQQNICDFNNRDIKYISYDNCCSCHLPTKQMFVNTYNGHHRRRIVFYARPIVNRNMYELGALVLIEAIRRGVLQEDDWDFYGVGLGDADLQLTEERKLCQLPRMNLKEYTENISGFDIGLTLMASPHPSLLPFDLAGSGCIVVTNECYNKTQAYFDEISGNIICKEADLDQLVDGIAEAVKRVSDLDTRYYEAENMKFPKTWDETWTDEHKRWIRERLGAVD